MDTKNEDLGGKSGDKQVAAKTSDIDIDFFTAEEAARHKYTFLEWINIFLMAAMIIIVFMQVVGRFVLKSGGFAFSDELGRMVFLGIVYLGLGVVTKYDLHFKADVITNMPAWIKKIQICFISILEIIVMVVLAYQGIELSKMTWTSVTSSLQWPVAVYYLPLTVGATGMIYYSILKLLNALRGK
jgi:TRAP-type C4-dicarboxylate transport system permease small subunit